MGKNILVIPDYHAHPDYDNKRAGYIGKHIVETDPDIVVCLGDFADMPSLNRAAIKHEGAKSVEGARYQRDIDAAEDAMETLLTPLTKASAIPKLVMLEGNHEGFIDKLLGDDPRFEGKISTEDLPYADWKVVPFKETFSYAGWAFCHFFSAGDMGRPIGGKNVAAMLVARNHMSSVVGHNHRFDYHEEARPDGKKVIGISAGCITHPGDIGDWNRQTHKSWWRGVIMINGAVGGQCTGIEAVSLEKLEEMYK